MCSVAEPEPYLVKSRNRNRNLSSGTGTVKNGHGSATLVMFEFISVFGRTRWAACWLRSTGRGCVSWSPLLETTGCGGRSPPPGPPPACTTSRWALSQRPAPSCSVPEGGQIPLKNFNFFLRFFNASLFATPAGGIISINSLLSVY